MKKHSFLLIAGLLLGGDISLQAEVKVQPSRTVDLGEFYAESNPSAHFELVNTGSHPVQITQVESGCICFEPVVFGHTIAPKKSIPLDVTIHPQTLYGSFEKGILIHFSNAPDIPLRIKGTARHAILNAPRFIAAGRIPLQQTWETNLVLHIRSDIHQSPTLHLQNIPYLEGKITPSTQPQQFNLHLRMPAQKKPYYWEGNVFLNFKSPLKIPPTPLKIHGYIGGTLHPDRQKIRGSTPGAFLLLRRKYPAGSPPRPTPIICNVSGIQIKEISQGSKTSRIEFTFSDDFLQKLQTQKRIPIQLSAKGFIPISLIVIK